MNRPASRGPRWWRWLKLHHQSIQAFAALATLVAAIGALAAVQLQINAAERTARQQSARDIYRDYLRLSAESHAFAQPDYCTLRTSPRYGAYEAYVAYMLYAGEQVISQSADWAPVIRGEMLPHAAYLCSEDFARDQQRQYDPAMVAQISQVQAAQCGAVKACGSELAEE